MECNRDEAVRSRCIAEQKFLQHDVLGARKFALKAQYLFPDLEGLPQLLAVLDVHIVAQQKVDGVDVNWYGILQTDASADDVTIRKQYRKLALVLHPDKNKAVGAEAAFKLISEAWRVLSDKEKKAVHDARRSGNGADLSAMKSMRGFCNFARFNGFSQPKVSDNLKRSFWSACPSCKMQFEFVRVHENKSISCPTCSKVFKATEMQDVVSGFRGQPLKQSSCAGKSSCPEKQAQTDGGSQDHVGSSFSFHWGPHRFNAAKYANATAQMVQQTYEAVRRERIKAQKEAREKAATARMEAEIEAIRRKLQERKQRRKEKQKKAAQTLSQQHEQYPMPKATFSQSEELGRANSGNSLPGDELGKGNVCMSSVITSTGEKESASGTRGKSLRMDQTQESYWCRMSRGFDSTNACEASDAFAFSKRLKIDV